MTITQSSNPNSTINRLDFLSRPFLILNRITLHDLPDGKQLEDDPDEHEEENGLG